MVENNFEGRVELFDGFGRLVISLFCESGTTELPTESLNPGIYLLKAIGEDGQVFRQKILKH